jgi:ATP-dependent RNA helicase RhlE
MNSVINKHQNNNTIFAKLSLYLYRIFNFKNMLFEDLSLSKSIQRAVYEQGYTNPLHSRTIYSASISRKDLIGCAQTGTGKTAAFAINYTSIAPYCRIIKKAKQIH